MTELSKITEGRAIVVVANRLPVDRIVAADGSSLWQTSPGGLVTAMKPIVEALGCVWVGWGGAANEQVEPFEQGRMQLVPVPLDETEVERYYEGFSNGTLWPLYHDVIAAPEYHRKWWESYRRVNQRFAEAAAKAAPEGAIVWVHDYQLQLVPQMLRELRPDLTISFFLHIPFPSRRLFAQLPWRREVVEGLLGADVLGFQREQDAATFRLAAEAYGDMNSHGNVLMPREDQATPEESTSGEDIVPIARVTRPVLAQEFPISIDTESFETLIESPAIRARAEQIRTELGNPRSVLLGVDRLDYTKGIGHRLAAFAELLADDEISTGEAVLVQVASPSRERVGAYQRLREEIETTVGRLNGMRGSIGYTPVVYLHQNQPQEEMAALYLAADVMVVTPLRDGMNLVAKEYVCCRPDEQGVLVLSEFTGAADELHSALLVNPHDVEAMKAALLRAIHMPEREQRRRMKALRQAVQYNDVHHWAESFLRATASAADRRETGARMGDHSGPNVTGPILLPSSLEGQLRRLATSNELIVACDFDGTVSPIVERPEYARILERAQRALDALADASGVKVAVLTGRSVAGLRETGIDTRGWVISGSHGAELVDSEESGDSDIAVEPLSDDEASRLVALRRRLELLFAKDRGVRVEMKPFGLAVHTRQVRDAEKAEELLEAASRIGAQDDFAEREGKRVREFTLRHSDKGSALRRIRATLPGAPVIFLGDDVTDEDVFKSLETDDLGIKVGTGETAAKERIADPNTVAAVLAKLLELRTGIVIGTDAE